jgi:hypothetical protein
MTHKRLGGLVLMAVIGGMSISPMYGQDAPAQPGQDAQARPGRGSRGGRDAQGQPGRGSRQGGRNRGGPRMSTPEDRERFYDQMVNRYMESMTSDYGLNDQQQAQAKARLEELKTQQKAFSDSRRQEMDSLREQMRALRDSGGTNGGFDSPQGRELGQRMRDLFQGAPLMNSDGVRAEVEKLLPPEQVAKGRAEHDRRHEEMRQQWQQRQAQGGNQQGRGRFGRRSGSNQGDPGAGPGQPGDQASLDGQDQGSANSTRDSRREEWRRRMEERRQADNQPDATVTVEQVDPLGPWERYVRDFIRRYQLDESQQAVALAILRDLQAQRDAYEGTHRTQTIYVQQIQDTEARRQQLESINAPVVGLFDQLKQRLDRIPTAAQRQAAGGPSSRPAGATSQPFRMITTSRPADNNQYNSGRSRSRRSRGSGGQ